MVSFLEVGEASPSPVEEGVEEVIPCLLVVGEGAAYTEPFAARIDRTISASPPA